MRARLWLSALLPAFACSPGGLVSCSMEAQVGSQPGTAATTPTVSTEGRLIALRNQIAALIADPAVSRAHWGIAVSTIEGTPVSGFDEGKLFRPASTAKLFTTAAAMALLGPDATVTTTVFTTGIIDPDGTLRGDLILRGAGDANLSGRHLPNESPLARQERVANKAAQDAGSDPLGILDDLAAQVAARGVKAISGQVVGDESLWPHEPYPVGWETDDLAWGYAAPVTALALDDNQLELTLTPAKGGSGFIATILPDVGYLSRPHQVIAVTAVSAKEPATLAVDLEELQKLRLRVQGQSAAGATRREGIAVLEPARFAADALKSRLAARGIQAGAASPKVALPLSLTRGFRAEARTPIDLHIPRERRPLDCNPCGDCGAACEVLATHVSERLSSDITVTLKDSLNLHAEMLLRRLGAAFGEGATFAQGARVVHQWLTDAGLPDTDFVLYDGSGLSTKDLVSPRAETQLLAFAATQPWFASWKAALPVGGVDGTLASRFTEPPLKGHIFAKTGTLGESRALAGYIQCASGRELIVAILVDNHDPSSSADRGTMDKIVAAIAQAN